MISFASKIDNRGPVLPVKCPRCSKTDLFDLHVCQGSMKLLGWFSFLGTGELWHLVCRHCAYEVRLEGEDIGRATELNGHANRYVSRKISRDEFVRVAKSIRLDCIELIRLSRETAPCPECGEDVPCTFTRCWNCDAELDSVGELPGADAEDAIPGLLDDDGASPFGGVRM